MQGVEAAGQDAGRGEPGGKPEVADEHQGVPVADPLRRDIGPRGHARHLQADEVVADGQAPDLLTDALGRAAAEGLLALEGVGFDLVKADLELSPLVIEVDDLRRGIGRGVEQRGEQSLRAEASPLVANGPGREDLR